MPVDKKKCAECGKPFIPCSTKVNGHVTWRRNWCSLDCYQKSLHPVATIATDSEVVFEAAKKSRKSKAEAAEVED